MITLFETYVARYRTDRGNKVIRVTGYSRLFSYLEYISYSWFTSVYMCFPGLDLWLCVVNLWMVICGYLWLSILLL